MRAHRVRSRVRARGAGTCEVQAERGTAYL